MIKIQLKLKNGLQMLRKKVSRKYPEIKQGEAFELNWHKRDLMMSCCDCGLVHRIRFIVKGRRIRVRMWRMNRHTGQVRRWNNIKVKETFEEEIK